MMRLLVVAFALSSLVPLAKSDSCVFSNNGDFSQTMLQQTNCYRRRHSVTPLSLNYTLHLHAQHFAEWLVDKSQWLKENRGTRLAHRDPSLLPSLPAHLQWEQPSYECTVNPEQCRYPFGESLFACYTTKKEDLCPATQASAQWYDRLRNEGDFVQMVKDETETVGFGTATGQDQDGLYIRITVAVYDPGCKPKPLYKVLGGCRDKVRNVDLCNEVKIDYGALQHECGVVLEGNRFNPTTEEVQSSIFGGATRFNPTGNTDSTFPRSIQNILLKEQPQAPRLAQQPRPQHNFDTSVLPDIGGEGEAPSSLVPGSKGSVKLKSHNVKAKKQFGRGKRQASLGLTAAEIDYAYKGEFGDAYFTYSNEADGTPHLNGHFQIDEKAYRIRRTVQGHILEKVADRLVNPEPDNPIESTGTLISPADANDRSPQTISIMVYYTPAFADQFLQISNTAASLKEIEKYIAMTNYAFRNSTLKGVKLALHCREEIEIMDNESDNSLDRLKAFAGAKGTTEELLHTADMAILLTSTQADNGYTGGRAYVPRIGFTSDQPIGWVTGGWAPNFAHEVGHIFGAKHDRENAVDKKPDETRYGALLRGSERRASDGSRIGLRTLMAYKDEGDIYRRGILHFSQDENVEGASFRFGDSQNNNVLQIQTSAKALAKKGDESCGCGDQTCFGCISNTDCPVHQECRAGTCSDPCPLSCGINAFCQVTHHSEHCYCPPGYIGNPYEACALAPPGAGYPDVSSGAPPSSQFSLNVNLERQQQNTLRQEQPKQLKEEPRTRFSFDNFFFNFGEAQPRSLLPDIGGEEEVPSSLVPGSKGSVKLKSHNVKAKKQFGRGKRQTSL